MIRVIGLLWEVIISGLSWLPPFCIDILTIAGTAAGIIFMIALLTKLMHVFKGD